jgi:peptidoglycan/xylan/chitin deacetylase (PgdA/CDA1 family)
VQQSRPNGGTRTLPAEPRLAADASRWARLRSGALRTLVAAAAPRSVLAVRGSRRDGRRRIAFTFDDGPNAMTPRYLDVLGELGIRATFFLIGENAARMPDVVADVAGRGHEVGGHGWSHTPFTRLEPAALRREIERTAAVMPRPCRLVRPPRGALSVRALAEVALAGYVTVLWSLDSDDCRTGDAREVEHRLAPGRIRAGDIVLLHELQPWTLHALERAVPRLRDAGFAFATVGDLLDEGPPA